MHSSRSRRFLVPATVVLAGVLALSACGSDDTTSTGGSSSTTTSTTTAPPTTGDDPAIKVAENATLGKILVDAEGRTVYTLTNDGAEQPCNPACMAVWPLVLLPAGVEAAVAGPGVTGRLQVKIVSEGNSVTHDDLPLYTFVQDTSPGDAKGEGLQSFGGTWNVVKVSGGGTDAGTSSSTSSSGY